jgi:hypothetical protein
VLVYGGILNAYLLLSLANEFWDLTNLLEVLDEVLGDLSSVLGGDLELGIDVLDGT